MAGFLLFGCLSVQVRAPLQAIGYHREFFLSYRFWLLLPVTIVMMTGCVGAVLRRLWGAAALGTTVLYSIASGLTFDVTALREIVERIYWGAPLNPGGGPDFSGNLVRLWAVQVAVFLFMASIVVLSQVVVAAATRAEDGDLQKPRTTAGQKRALLFGAGLVVAGLLYKSLDLVLFDVSIATVGASFAIVVGSFLAMFAHMRMRRHFLASSAILTALALVIAPQTAGPAFWAVVPWLLPLGLGMASLLRKNADKRLGLVAIGLTVFLAALFVAEPFPLYLRFGVYPKPSTTRPANFPAYMQAPEGAAQVQYYGGNEPSLYFFVDDPFPAEPTLAFIEDHLSRAGWQKLDYSLMNPNFPSSHKAGWSDVMVGSSPTRAEECRRWMGHWINKERQTIAVMLEYHSAEEVQQDATQLRCVIHQSAPRGLQLKFIENYERIHGPVLETAPTRQVGRGVHPAEF